MTYFNDNEGVHEGAAYGSRFGHCPNDLLYRWNIGALPIDIVGVVSNHIDRLLLGWREEANHPFKAEVKVTSSCCSVPQVPSAGRTSPCRP